MRGSVAGVTTTILGFAVIREWRQMGFTFLKGGRGSLLTS